MPKKGKRKQKPQQSQRRNEDGEKLIGAITKALPKIISGAQAEQEAVQKCIEVCGPARSRSKKKNGASTQPNHSEDVEMAQDDLPGSSSSSTENDPVDGIELQKQILKEMKTVGVGQEQRIREMLKKLHEFNAARDRMRMEGRPPRSVMLTMLAEQGKRLPLWITPELGQFPPPLVGAIPVGDSYKLAVEDFCATYSDEMWYLGQVKRVTDMGRYEIRDVDDLDKGHITLLRKRLIPLPKYRADPERDGHALFPKNAWVLAMYPQTTVFYKGLVESPPKDHRDTYKVVFDDPSYPTGFSPILEIHQRYVLAFKDLSAKTKKKLVDLTKEEIEEIKQKEKAAKEAEKKKKQEDQKLKKNELPKEELKAPEKEEKKAKKAEQKEKLDMKREKQEVRGPKMEGWKKMSKEERTRIKAEIREQKMQAKLDAREEAKRVRKEERDAERERKKEEKKEMKKLERAQKKEERIKEKERIKNEIREQKLLAREERRKERNREKNRRAKERKLQRLAEEEERKKNGETSEGVEKMEEEEKEEEPEEEEEEEEEKEEENESEEEEEEEEEEGEEEEEDDNDDEEEEEEEVDDDEDEDDSEEEEM